MILSNTSGLVQTSFRLTQIVLQDPTNYQLPPPPPPKPPPENPPPPLHPELPPLAPDDLGGVVAEEPNEDVEFSKSGPKYI